MSEVFTEPPVAWLVGLTKNQIKLLKSMARAMQIPVAISDRGASDIVDDVFAETMANTLAAHHALHEEALNKKAFEYLFKNCRRAQGDTSADLNLTPGAESWDVRDSSFRWSLKTEAAQGISRNQIRVEKLMEARWVREALTPADCAREVAWRLPEHMVDYDRILVLRAFAVPGGYEYLLQEIPKQLLVVSFQAAASASFKKSARSISFGADFHNPSGQKVFRVLLDSSVEKVRLWFRSDAAILHGRWNVPVEHARRAQQNSVG